MYENERNGHQIGNSTKGKRLYAHMWRKDSPHIL